MNTNIKIFKLVSGDELIGDMIEGSDELVIKISQPMIFRTSAVMDDRGYPYDVTVLQDWLIRTDNKIAEIPKNQVLTVFDPNEQTVKLYTLELDRIKDAPQEEIVKADDAIMENFADEQHFKAFNDMMENFLSNMDQLSDGYQKSSEKKRKKKKAPKTNELNINNLIPDELRKRPMIYLSMVIPPEAIMNLISAGIIDPEQLLIMIEEIKKENKFTGDEKKRKDFGNKFSDWNPDPESPEYE